MMSKNVCRLNGENVKLCTFRRDMEAIEIYHSWINDESILHFISKHNQVISLKEEEEWAMGSHRDINFNIVDKVHNTLIGNCGISLTPSCGSNASIGILIGNKDFRNKGYGTEVVKMLIKFAFEELGVHRVHLTLNSENERAHKCYLKAGLKDEGIAREAIYHEGRYTDLLYMGILANEYFKNKKEV
jgi:RimJ/RimL family protein N-acetyltransferase